MSGDGVEEDQVLVKVEPTTSSSVSTITTTAILVTSVTSSTSTTTTSSSSITGTTESSSGPLLSVTSTFNPATQTPPLVSTPVSGNCGIVPASWASPVPVPTSASLDITQEEEAEEESNATGDNVPERVYLTPEQINILSKEEITEKWALQEKFLDFVQNRMEILERNVEELHGVRENEERLKGQLSELQRKEQYHIMRLSSKENELQDLAAQIQELKNVSVGVGGLRNCLLDPAINLLFERLKRDLDTARTKMEETQNELSAWKFTPDSNTGKQLMARCRLLIKENEELGRMITGGRLAKLEGELALQRNFSEELKKSQSELDEFLLEMDEDTEGMQGTIYYLQQQLRQAKERISQLSSQLTDNNQNPSASASLLQTGDDTSNQILTEDCGSCSASDLNNEMERTGVTLVPPQPNGNATHEESNAFDSEDYGTDTSAIAAVAPLTNGRKRTQSEMDEEGAKVGDGEELGSEDRRINTGEERDLAVSDVDSLHPPQKRTRTDGGEVIEGGVGGGMEEESTVIENGVTESE